VRGSRPVTLPSRPRHVQRGTARARAHVRACVAATTTGAARTRSRVSSSASSSSSAQLTAPSSSTLAANATSSVSLQPASAACCCCCCCCSPPPPAAAAWVVAAAAAATCFLAAGHAKEVITSFSAHQPLIPSVHTSVSSWISPLWMSVKTSASGVSALGCPVGSTHCSHVESPAAAAAAAMASPPRGNALFTEAGRAGPTAAVSHLTGSQQSVRRCLSFE
jgi:hypothetical protein